ncbi:MAG: hypothetical protein CG445_405 [Methanosaeta sp. ASM2]|nr:MAG: hypothetical protein CG445_405 [Methanosaeta sp. ASM2]
MLAKQIFGASDIWRHFRIEGKIEIDEDALVEERRRFGRFVLASNDVNLDQELMLNYYKGQQVETVLYNI